MLLGLETLVWFGLVLFGSVPQVSRFCLFVCVCCETHKCTHKFLPHATHPNRISVVFIIMNVHRMYHIHTYTHAQINKQGAHQKLGECEN